VPDRPLLVTADNVLLDDLLRVCAAAGVDPEVAPDVAGARAAWPDAPLVVVGDDLSRAAADAGLPRRRDVVLVTRDVDDIEVWVRAAAVGADGALVLPGSEALLVERLAAGRESAAALVAAVIGGRGGAGASTLACALAVTAAAERRTMLVDADPLGGGIDLLLGGEQVPGPRWADLAEVSGRLSATALSDALPACHGVRVLSWDRGEPRQVVAGAVHAVLDAGRRGQDLVVVDLARHPDVAARQVVADADVLYVVVPAEVRAVAAAARVVAQVRPVAHDVRLVVRGPAPSDLTGEVVADTLGLPLAGWLRPEAGLSRALERGDPPAGSGRGPLAALCRALLGGHLAAVRPAA
jgi:secretion/DNA translocation related CpaE-like protein